MSELEDALFPSKSRAALLRLLFRERVLDSVSGLARRMALSPRAVAREVNNLLKANLVLVESIGGSDLVRANTAHPASRHLEALLQPMQSEDKFEPDVRSSLMAWGAPLVGRKSSTRLPFNETLLSALKLAQRDGTVLRVLPLVLAKNLAKLDWPALKQDARREKLKAELGMLVELTADLLQLAELKERVSDLRDGRRTLTRFFPEARSRFEKRLAMDNSPPAATRWGFRMNMTEESFRATLDKHLA